MTETCTKCAIRERAVGHKWCNGCQSAARKERRLVSNGVSNPPVSNAPAVQLSNPVPPDEGEPVPVVLRLRPALEKLCGRCADRREAVAALFDAFVTDPAVRQALARIPWGGFRDKVMGAL